MIGWCLWSIRVQTHKWRNRVAWLARVIKFNQSSLWAKIFKNSVRKENENYPALVKVFNEKQAAEYLTQWEEFTSAKHPRSLPGKNYRKLLESFVVESFPTPRKIHEWPRLNTLQLAELDNFHNEKSLAFHWRFKFESFCLFVGFPVNLIVVNFIVKWSWNEACLLVL